MGCLFQLALLLALVIGVAVWVAVVALGRLLGITGGAQAGVPQRQVLELAAELARIDQMSGADFERYVASLLKLQGYSVMITQHSGDLGVDIVATRGVEVLAVQAKRHRSPVSRHAVSDVVGGMSYYHCNAAMVVTNSRFSPGARALARANSCRLVDREELGRMIVSSRPPEPPPAVAAPPPVVAERAVAAIAVPPQIPDRPALVSREHSRIGAFRRTLAPMWSVSGVAVLVVVVLLVAVLVWMALKIVFTEVGGGGTG